MCEHLHVLVVFHCLVFGASCSVFFFFLRVCRVSCSVWSSLLFLSPHCAVMWYSWVGPFVCGFFQVFSGPPCDLHPIACWQVCCQFFLSQLLHHLGIQWQSQRLHQDRASNSLPNKITVMVAYALQHSLMTSVSTLCADNHAPLVSSAAPFPPSVLSVVSSSAMVAASSLASTSVFRYVETTSISVYVHHHFHHQQLLLGRPCSIDQCSNYDITCFQPLFGSDSLASLCDKALVVGPGHAPFPVKLVKNY